MIVFIFSVANTILDRTPRHMADVFPKSMHAVNRSQRIRDSTEITAQVLFRSITFGALCITDFQAFYCVISSTQGDSDLITFCFPRTWKISILSFTLEHIYTLLRFQ